MGKSQMQQKQRMAFLLPITKKREIIVPHQYGKCYKDYFTGKLIANKLPLFNSDFTSITPP